jgi:hypothetical protein
MAEARAIACCKADLSEPWQILQAPRGVLLQPAYCSGCELTDAAVPRKTAPLELKLHVFFGVVLGGTLHTHPWNVWIDHTGCVHIFERAARKVGTRTRTRTQRHTLHVALIDGSILWRHPRYYGDT